MEPIRDSVFVSALRSFCKAVAVIIGIFVALIPISLVFISLGSGPEIESKTTLTILPDANNERIVHAPNSPAILRINIVGEIGKPMLDSETVENQLVDSRAGMLANNRVKGILLYICSPGGTTIDSDNIYRNLLAYKNRYKLPVYAYVDGLCASGGLYIACAADKIYCSPPSIIGSVGVVMGPFFNFKEGMNKLGVDAVTLTEGKNKDMMNPFRTWKPGEDEALKNLGAFFYERFVDVVAQARTKVDKDKLVNEYGANVFDPVTAEKIGYVDGMTDYDVVLRELMKTAGIDETKPYQVLKLEPKKSLLASFATSNSSFQQAAQFFFRKEAKLKSPLEQFSYLYQTDVVQN
jgi:protease IV